MSDTHVAFDVVAAAVAARVLHAIAHTNWVGGAAAGRGHRRGAWWQLCSTLRAAFNVLVCYVGKLLLKCGLQYARLFDASVYVLGCIPPYCSPVSLVR